MSNHHHPPEDRDWHEYQDWLETHDYAVINNAIALIRAHCKSHHHWVCDRLLEVRHRAAYAETRLAELAAKEETYSSPVNRDARNAWIPPPAYARTKTCRARDARSTGETPMTNDQRERLRELAKANISAGSIPNQRDLAGMLKAFRGLRCNCDLDNWEPTQQSGHSHVCRIHKSSRDLLHASNREALHSLLKEVAGE